MRRRLGLSIGITFLLGGLSVFCTGQCADTFNEMQFHCAGPGGCEDQVAVFYPNESEYGVFIECGSEDCCGQLFTTCWGGGFCNPDMLKKPGVRKEIAQLAATGDLLVADCTGRYVSYNPVPSAPSTKTLKERYLVFLDERVLR